MAESKTSERRLTARERQLQALQMRQRGISFPAIAKALGYRGPSGAYQAVMGAIQETLREPAEDVRLMELARLDAMLESVWPAALGGHIGAQVQVLRIMERRAKYLGLDAPAKIDIEQRIRVMAEQMGLDPDEAVAEATRILKETRGKLSAAAG